MTLSTPKAASEPPDRPELAPRYFDTRLIVAPPDGPPCNPGVVARLAANMEEHGQLVPGWVFPPDPVAELREIIEGNHRLAACRQLGRPFWAFDTGRNVPEAERIRLTFQHNQVRRVMGRDEIAERAARFIELTGCAAFEAARMLGISGPTLSRAFGEKRIPAGLKPRTDRLNLSIRSLVAAAPEAVMERAVDFAEAPLPDGKAKTRDQVAAYIRQLKKGEAHKGGKPRPVTLRVGGRTLTLTIATDDTAGTVAEELKAIAAKLAKLSDIKPEGWHFHFQ